MKAYTDLEQSKKLAEILPIESADMYYQYALPKSDKIRYNPILGNPIAALEWYNKGYTHFGNPPLTLNEYCIPCWSLAALMNLLPSEFTEKEEYSETTYQIDIRKYALTDDADIYQIAYGNYKFYEDGNRSWKDMVNTGEKENLIDAAFQMICWLKENKKI